MTLNIGLRVNHSSSSLLEEDMSPHGTLVEARETPVDSTALCRGAGRWGPAGASLPGVCTVQ